MAKLPLTTLAIVIPVYSGEKYLESLIEQTACLRESLGVVGISLCEVIAVVDDAKDDSFAVLQQSMQKYDFLRSITLASNVGQHQATSVGILSAGSEWIITMDEDLQHTPALIPLMLYRAVEMSFDLVYCKSRSQVHRGLAYRDITSRISKSVISQLTNSDFTGVSSFRLIRSEIAKAAAISMDSTLYFDSLLFRVTSEKRRLTLYKRMSDLRPKQSSYSIKRLVQHFVRFLTSADVRFTKLTAALLGVTLTLIASFMLLIVYGYYDGVLESQPGWTSTILASLFNIVICTFGFLFTYKFLNILTGRSLRLPSFIVVDRQNDRQISDALYQYISSYPSAED